MDRSCTFRIAKSVVERDEMAAAISQLSPAGGLLCMWHKEAKATGGLRFPPDPRKRLFTCEAMASEFVAIGVLGYHATLMIIYPSAVNGFSAAESNATGGLAIFQH